MKRFFLHTSPLLIVAFLTSCVRDIVLDANEKPTIVVECILSDKESQELRLNFTKGVSKEETDSITEAVATLIDLTESQTVGQFKRQTGDLWILDYSAVPEHQYRLEVQVPGYDLIYAEDTMPQKMISYSLSFSDSFHNVPTEHHPTIPKEYPREFVGTYHWFECNLPDYMWIYGLNYNENTGEREIADRIFTNLPGVDAFNITNEIYIPTLRQLSLNDKDVYRLAVRYINLRGEAKHKHYLRIEGNKLNYKEIGNFLVFGDFTGWWYGGYSLYDFEGYLIFMSVSEIYDTYLKDAIQTAGIKNISDLSSVYLRNNLHSNIKGGIGIFGCMSEQITPCIIQESWVAPDEYPKFGIGTNHRFI